MKKNMKHKADSFSWFHLQDSAYLMLVASIAISIFALIKFIAVTM